MSDIVFTKLLKITIFYFRGHEKFDYPGDAQTDIKSRISSQEILHPQKFFKILV